MMAGAWSASRHLLAGEQLELGRREDRSNGLWSLEHLAGANGRRSVERAVAGIEGRQPRALRCVRFHLHCLPRQRRSAGRGDGSENAAIQRGASSIRCGKSEGQGVWSENTQAKGLARRSRQEQQRDDEGSVVHVLDSDRPCRSAGRNARVARDGNRLTQAWRPASNSKTA